MTFTILGCGSSGGVPRVGGADGRGDWGACDPLEPRNRRTRCSALIRRSSGAGETAVLIDTSPDLRTQLMAACVRKLDAIVYTHDHADQTHGIDDVRPLSLAMRTRIPVYLDHETAGGLVRRFDYCFRQPEGGFYPPIFEARELPAPGEALVIEGAGGPITVAPFVQHHGAVNSLGFRIGAIAYSSDVVGLPEESFQILEGVRIWVVDALQYAPHATHAHLDLALEWIARVKPERAVLTNLHVHMDYATLKAQLPPHVTPAYDGMVLDVD